MQTVKEGAKFGIEVNICRSQENVKPGVNITNYEMLDKFNPDRFGGVVLDESSILKSYMGKTKKQIIDAFRNTRFKLTCTATPAPNNHLELLNQAEFLGIMRSNEVCIWMDPVLEMQKTKSQGLLYKQLRKDSSYSRQGMPDYLVVFRKWTEDCEDAEPVTHTKENFPLEMWQRYASPVWFDIRRTNVLNCKIARENEDEKHICPLQLDVIERAIELWTNPDDIVFTPFLGIGSEAYQALKMGRRAVGTELKESYFNQAVANCNEVISSEQMKF